MERFLRIFFVLAALLVGVLASAQSESSIQNSAAPQVGKVSLSVGWGDQGFEKICWHEKAEAYNALSSDSVVNVNEDYRYSQHWFVSGTYWFTKWLGAGLMADIGGVSWKNKNYIGGGELREVIRKDHFTNIVIMPTVNFSYMNKKYISLHSGLGAGLGINTGSEVDYLGRKTEFAPAFYVNTIGIKGKYDRYFVSFDLGALFSLKSSDEVYMFGSRLLSVSAGINL